MTRWTAPVSLLAPLVLALFAPAAQAQSSCSSDGAPPPQALFERFISADCATCWSDPSAPAPGKTAAVLDWIVPGAAGEEAPLSAAATRDALARLSAVGRTAPAASDVHTASRTGALPGRLRVALGQAVNDYVGTVLSYAGPVPAAQLGDLSAWMALVEQVPAGTDGTAVPRGLVRNLLQVHWKHADAAAPAGRGQPPQRWLERRSMQLPEGTNPERLALVAWLEDAEGRVLALERTHCAAPG